MSTTLRNSLFCQNEPPLNEKPLSSQVPDESFRTWRVGVKTPCQVGCGYSEGVPGYVDSYEEVVGDLQMRLEEDSSPMQEDGRLYVILLLFFGGGIPCFG